MYAKEKKVLETVLRNTLNATAAEFRLKLLERCSEEGYQALSPGAGLQVTAPQLVLFRDPLYAVVYLLSDPEMTDPEFEVFKKKAQSFAWEHDAAAYFVHFTLEPLP